ncbi:MAG: hypothetical protein RXR82_06755 [Nitrososphaeria archaeon]
MCAQEQIMRGPVLRRVEHWVVMRAAWAAARLRAPDAVLMVSRRGVRFFATDSLAAPAWWLSVAVRDPAAAPGRAVMAPAADFWGALRMTLWRGRGGNHIAVGPGAVHFDSPAAAVEVHGRAVDFGVGAGIPVGEGEELEVGDYYPVAVADAPSTISADAAAVAARSDAVELRFTRDDRGWWLEVGGDGEVRRAPARMLLLPPNDGVIGRYPAAVVAELLSLLELAEPTVELTEPPERPALRAGWEHSATSRARVEFFVAPLA